MLGLGLYLLSLLVGWLGGKGVEGRRREGVEWGGEEV